MGVRLGSLQLETDLLLAPMMDVTTPSFRRLILDQGGVGMVITPMVFVQQISKAPKTVLPHLEDLENQLPAGIQLVASGRQIEEIQIAIDILESYTFDLIDINAGCPAAHTMRSGGGGGYLKEYSQTGKIDRLKNVVDACLRWSSRPVSLKTRLGFRDPNDILQLIPEFNGWGLEFLTVHGRTVSQRYRDTCDLEAMAKARELCTIPFIGNGDVVNRESYLKMKRISDADAVMIGRGAMHNPNIFREISSKPNLDDTADQDSAISGCEDHHVARTMDLNEIRELIEKNDLYLRNRSRYWNSDRFRLAEMRRLIIWFIKGIPGYRKVREIISKIQDVEEIKEYFFTHSADEDFQKFGAHSLNPTDFNEHEHPQ